MDKWSKLRAGCSQAAVAARVSSSALPARASSSAQVAPTPNDISPWAKIRAGRKELVRETNVAPAEEEEEEEEGYLTWVNRQNQQNRRLPERSKCARSSAGQSGDRNRRSEEQAEQRSSRKSMSEGSVKVTGKVLAAPRVLLRQASSMTMGASCERAQADDDDEAGCCTTNSNILGNTLAGQTITRRWGKFQKFLRLRRASAVLPVHSERSKSQREVAAALLRLEFDQPISSCCFARNGRMFAGAAGDILHTHSSEDGSKMHAFNVGSDVSACIFLDIGATSLLAAATLGGEVLLFDVSSDVVAEYAETPKPSARFKYEQHGRKQAINCIANGGQTLAIGANSPEIWLCSICAQVVEGDAAKLGAASGADMQIELVAKVQHVGR